MNTTTARPAVAAAGAALVLLLTACGGGGDPDPGVQQGAIDLLFEDMYGEWDPEQSNQDMIRMEEIIAECMTEQGFDYTPVDYSQGGSPMPVEDDGIEEEWGTIEFARKWGYGATTNPGGQADPEPVDPGGEEWVDPNAEYVESMTESELAAYNTAMFGEQWNAEPTEDMETEEFVWDWKTAGCSGLAQHEIYGDAMTPPPDDDFADLEAEMQVMWESITNDPRLAEVAGEWAACMAGAGYSGLSDVSDAENLIHEQVNALWEDAYADVAPDADEEAWRAIEESVQEEMAAIAPEEIKTAVDDFTCRDKVGYTRVQAEVNVARQQEFYDLHSDELIAWAEARSGKTG